MTTPHHDDHEVPTIGPDGVPIFQGPDGLQEADNPTPRWMVLAFWGMLIWGVAYLVAMPGMGINMLGWSQYKQYDAEVADAKTRYAAATPADPAAALAAALSDPKALEAGKAAYAASCAACHGADGKGAIGPSLADATWLYGAEPAKIAHTIAEGTAKGMPPFKTALSPAQLAEVTAFVHSLAK